MKKIKTFFLVLRCLLFTCKVSLQVVFSAIRGKLDRIQGDRYVQIWANGILGIIQLDYQVFNPHNIQFKVGEQYIVMCNHASNFDIPLCFVALKTSLRMVAKIEIRKWPFLGKAMSELDFVFIDRSNTAKAVDSLKQAQDKMRSGITVWIAPEGTRTRTGKMQSFKKGGFMLAIQSGATIIPVGLRGSGDIMQPGSAGLNPDAKAEVHIGEPIDSSQYALKNRQQLMSVVEASIKRLAGQS